MSSNKCYKDKEKTLSSLEDEQNAFKESLMALKYLLDDLKIVKSARVKDFIFDNVYQSMGDVEKSYNRILEDCMVAKVSLEKLEQLSKARLDLQSWQLHALQQFAAADKKIAEQEAINTKADQEEDKRLLNEVFPLIANQLGADCQIPSEEVSAYQCWLEGPDIYSMVNKDGLSCGFGKLIVNEELAEDWKLHQEQIRIAQEQEQKTQELLEKQKQELEKQKQEMEEKDIEEAQTIAEASAVKLELFDGLVSQPKDEQCSSKNDSDSISSESDLK